MASTALYSTSAASAKFLSTASDPSSTRSKAVKNVNCNSKNEDTKEKSGFDLLDELTQQLVDAFEKGEVINEKGDIVNENDLNKMFGNCQACGLRIEKEAAVVNEAHYHPSCFTCHDCNQPFGTDKYFIIREQNFCKLCKDKYLETCSKCGEKIDENAVRTKGSDEAYHPDCFVCYKCGNVLHGKFYNTDDGQHLCETDFMATREKCFRCGRALLEASLKALGNKYHPDCFVCSMCPKRLDGEVFFFSEETNQPLCKEDYERYEAKTCDSCSKKIVEEKFISTSVGKFFHQDCYAPN